MQILTVKPAFHFIYDFVAEKPKLPEKKYYIDTNHIHIPKDNMEIINPVKDGMSEYKENYHLSI